MGINQKGAQNGVEILKKESNRAHVMRKERIAVNGEKVGRKETKKNR